MIKLKIKNIQILRLLKYLLLINGILFIISILLAFSTLPYWGYHWLGTSKSELSTEPEAIILLGGGGMPSESNLMRSWYTAKAAKSFPHALVYIVMPGDLGDSASTPNKMMIDLLEREVKKENIRFENKGTNTRSQALNCSKNIDNQKSLLLVTSPEHMRRSVLCFQKAGFTQVNALPAFEDAAEADFSFDDDELGGNKIMVPDVGKNTAIRYQVWNHLKYEILIVRECLALCYYKLRGWI